VALRVIEDLERGDLDSATVTILRDDLFQKDSIIFVKDSVIAKQKRTIALCEQSVSDCGEIGTLNERTIQNLNIKLNRETKKKKTWRIIAGGFALLAIIVAK
jgi:hypothetical protein